MRAPKWECPHCDQTSSRHWNLKTHIKRHHDNVGYPMSVEKEHHADNPRKPYDYRQRDYSGSHSFHSIAAATKDDSWGLDLLDTFLPYLRKRAEFLDLIRKISPQQALTNDNMIPWPTLLSSLNFFQKNNNRKSDELPVGYRVQACNKCLSCNSLEPVFGLLEFEALTKIKHICREREAVRLSTIQLDIEDHPNNIKEAQEKLLYVLRQVVYYRISQQPGHVGRQLLLSAREFGGPQALLRQVGNKKLPDNKSWIEEEDYIDLGTISSYSKNSSVENQNHWAFRLIREDSVPKIIKINQNELNEFIGVCKATFGIFQIRTDYDRIRYFLVSIVL